MWILSVSAWEQCLLVCRCQHPSPSYLTNISQPATTCDILGNTFVVSICKPPYCHPGIGNTHTNTHTHPNIQYFLLDSLFIHSFVGFLSPQAQSSPLTPGHCWAFAGRQGHVFISLSHPVTITHVTLGHISSRQSIAGFTYSAPREFSVYVSNTFAIILLELSPMSSVSHYYTQIEPQTL